MRDYIVCTPKSSPRNMWVSAARKLAILPKPDESLGLTRRCKYAIRTL
jgi:hypothetical protein